MTLTACGVVLVTASSEAEAQQLAQALVTERLAACVSIVPIQSVYTWQGDLCNEIEYQLTIKTDLAHFSQLAQRIQALHSYDVPEIVALPIQQGTAAYLSWVRQQVGTAPSSGDASEP
ncbi:MAG: divalent-cation tolerance protein CutA [Cyanobacteria bacterium P01_A01_bin.105]